MQLVMTEGATSEQVEEVTVRLRRIGLEPALVPGGGSTRISLAGKHGGVDSLRLDLLPGVLRVIEVAQPFRKASWEFRDEPTIVALPNATRIGGREVVVMVGPCPLEPDARVGDVARMARAAGATLLHGGEFGPRGLPRFPARGGERALETLVRARSETGMALVAEALDADSARVLARYVDVLRVGPANMQNFPLLRQVARLGKPVLLVRGPAATIPEFLQAAEYVLVEGNEDVLLCEAGILNPSAEGRPLLDLTAVPVLRSLSHLPVLVGLECSDRGATAALASAAIAAGADGVCVAVRSTPVPPPPGDDTESLEPAAFARVMEQARRLSVAVGRRLGPPPGGVAAGRSG